MAYTGKVEAPIYINGTPLPLYASIKDTTEPNLSKNYSLDGTLTVDYVNNRRRWEVSWNYLTAAEHDTIRALYDNQFAANNFSMPTLWIPSVNLAVNVLISIADKNIKWNGKMVEDFTIILEEQFGLS